MRTLRCAAIVVMVGLFAGCSAVEVGTGETERQLDRLDAAQVAQVEAAAATMYKAAEALDPQPGVTVDELAEVAPTGYTVAAAGTSATITHEGVAVQLNLATGVVSGPEY